MINMQRVAGLDQGTRKELASILREALADERRILYALEPEAHDGEYKTKVEARVELLTELAVAFKD